MISIQLISIIVDIEDKFAIEIPDVYMVPEFLSSFDHVLAVIQELVESRNNAVEDTLCIPSKTI
jgi:acyl carrier protein